MMEPICAPVSDVLVRHDETRRDLPIAREMQSFAPTLISLRQFFQSEGYQTSPAMASWPWKRAI